MLFPEKKKGKIHFYVESKTNKQQQQQKTQNKFIERDLWLPEVEGGGEVGGGIGRMWSKGTNFQL